MDEAQQKKQRRHLVTAEINLPESPSDKESTLSHVTGLKGTQDGSFDDGSITIPNEEEQYGTVMATRSIINGSNRPVSRRGAHLSSIGRHILDGLSCSDALAVGSDF